MVVGKPVLERVEREENAMGKLCKQVENERHEEDGEGCKKERRENSRGENNTSAATTKVDSRT